MAGTAAEVGLYLVNHIGGNISRVPDVFGGVTDRPAAPSPPGSDPQTWLVVGYDSRANIASGELPDARFDVIMLVRFTGDRKHAQVISIPRDSWVFIPGAGMSRIKAAYSYGGPSLLLATLERLTQVRIDHFVAFDFQGFVTITNALGGVDVDIAAQELRGCQLPGREEPPRGRTSAGLRPASTRTPGGRLRPGQAAAAGHRVTVRQAPPAERVQRPRDAHQDQ